MGFHYPNYDFVKLEAFKMSNYTEPIFNPIYIDANNDSNRHQLGSSNTGLRSPRNINPPINTQHDNTLNIENTFTRAADLVNVR